MATTDIPLVLVIEDDPPVRALLDDVLQDEGYAVMTVHDGAAALRVLESVQVDLITLDLDLPGLTGDELLHMLERRKLRVPPVIMMTGGTPVPRAVKQLADRVLDKPFDIDDLMRAVRDVLPRPAGRTTGRSRRVGDGGESPVQDA
jgi:DNA-binding response OmpR family regulator